MAAVCLDGFDGCAIDVEAARREPCKVTGTCGDDDKTKHRITTTPGYWFSLLPAVTLGIDPSGQPAVIIATETEPVQTWSEASSVATSASAEETRPSTTDPLAVSSTGPTTDDQSSPTLVAGTSSVIWATTDSPVMSRPEPTSDDQSSPTPAAGTSHVISTTRTGSLVTSRTSDDQSSITPAAGTSNTVISTTTESLAVSSTAGTSSRQDSGTPVTGTSSMVSTTTSRLVTASTTASAIRSINTGAPLQTEAIAIASGSVAGAMVLAVLALLVWVCRQRRKKVWRRRDSDPALRSSLLEICDACAKSDTGAMGAAEIPRHGLGSSRGVPGPSRAGDEGCTPPVDRARLAAPGLDQDAMSVSSLGSSGPSSGTVMEVSDEDEVHDGGD